MAEPFRFSRGTQAVSLATYSSPINQPVNIRAQSVRNAQARLANGVLVPTGRYPYYHVMRWENGSIAATLHAGEGIVLPNQNDLWRVVKLDNVRTLMMPTVNGVIPLASYFNTGLSQHGKVDRITIGGERAGGYELEGRGFRGSWLVRRSDGKRVYNLIGDEGDPPQVYTAVPTRKDAEIPFSVLLLVCYVLLEREIRDGCFVKRPT